MTLLIGAHLNKNGKSYLATIKTILQLGGNVASIFIGSPQDMKITTINPKEAEQVAKFIEDNDILLFSHSKYCINLASPKAFAYHLYSTELNNIFQMGGIGSVVHVGKSVSLPLPEAEKNMKNNVKKVIQKVFTTPQKKEDLRVIIETGASCGTEMYWKIEDLGKFYKSFTTTEKKYIRFCIDTCHIFSAGYDIRTKEGMKDFLKLWNKHIGIHKIDLIHLNDSKAKLGSRVDRHEKLRIGYITNPSLNGSITGIKYLVRFCKKHSIPMILERGSTGATKNEISFVKSLAE